MRRVALRHLRTRFHFSPSSLRHHSTFVPGTSQHGARTTATSSSSAVLYLPIEDVESPYGYSPGDYHPIDIGDHLGDRYRVVHKLGYGGFSTIWLARDEIASKYVAVKIGIANSDHREVDIIRQLSHPSHGLQQGYVLPILDHFYITGPNGTHPCFVTALARCSLRDAQDTAHPYMFQLPVARYIAAQMVNVVVYIHSRGLVHGDLHLGNFLLRLPFTLDHLSDKKIYEKFGTPNPEPIVREDGQPLPSGVPSHVYWPIWMAKAGDKLTLSKSKIILADFGTAFYPNRKPRFGYSTSLDICPPEARFEPTTPLAFSADIWTLAHAIWAVMGLRTIFGSFLLSEDDVTQEQVDTLGRLPDEWWNKWDARSRWFMEDGSNKNGGCPEKLEGRFKSSIQDPRRKYGMEILGEEESHAFKEMIQWMLSYRPGHRPTAEQLLNTDWLKCWAIPEFENIHK
ncbi:kinase domain-containing protein [Fusarium denticulatum]|uniref:non-specific serine/threonine protein kinase n=1 Tax=Fusarium denticulatum TaxID=48507 RepID=A0A8H5X5R7_9HYPO|nr:kinase domain-containing protein [Fusarium denticulatum]